MRKYKLLTLLVACIMLIVACGSGEIFNDDYPNDTEAENETPPTLSIFAPEFYRSVINQAVRHMSLAEEGRVNLELTTYTPGSREAHITRLQTMLMAGDAPDMFFLDGHPLRAFVQSGFLTDIYDLMDACPLTDREDFFTQPLAAMEMYDGLYAFPMGFGFNHVLINSSLPQPIIDRFSQYESITITDLMALYTDLMRDYGDEFGHLTFSGGTSRLGINPQIMFQSYVNSYIDFENRTSNLADLSYSDFLDDFRAIFEERWIGDYNFFRYIVFTSPNLMQTIAAENVFWIVNSGWRDPGYGFFSTGRTYFLHSVPISDAHGNLKIGPSPSTGFDESWAVVCIPATGNEQLAWRFSQHLLDEFIIVRSEGSRSNWNLSFASPIVRDAFLLRMTESFEDFISYTPVPQSQDFRTIMTSELPSVISYIAELNEMPMSLTYSFLPESLYFDLLDQFMLGAITSEVFAQQLQNRVSLWLIE